MELWYTEQHTKDVRFSIKVKEHLCTKQSRFQRIDIFDSVEFGRFFTLDGLMMITEKDEYIYHDMIVHVPMAVNEKIKNVLVIGAGDGGTIRELSKYSSVENIDMVEIDEDVIKICKEYFPQTSCKLSDSRVNLFIEDGLKFVRSRNDEYDLIIVDSTDPFGPGEGLFTKEFYGNCYKALKSDGILVNQHESAYYKKYAKAMKRAHVRIKEFFPVCKVYLAHIPTYPSGQWLFGFASKKYHPIKDFDRERWDSLNLETRYYNTDIHTGSFALPNYIKEMLENADE